ncbi:hypothetical protein WA158_007496 [Blastocystis sp. Blastoise]
MSTNQELLRYSIQSNWYQCDEFYIYDDFNHKQYNCKHENTQYVVDTDLFTIEQILTSDNSPTDSKYLYSGSEETITQYESPNKILNTIKGHSFETTSVRYLPSGQVILSGGYDHKVNIWSIKGTLARSMSGSTGRITCLDYIHEGKQVIGGNSNGDIHIYECKRGISLSTLSTIPYINNYNTSIVNCITSCHYMGNDTDSSSNLVVCSSKYGIFSWDITSEDNIFSINKGFIPSVSAFNNTLVYIQNGSIYIHDLRNIENPISIITPSTTELTKVIALNDSEYLCGEIDGSIYVVSIKNNIPHITTFLSACQYSINDLNYKNKKLNNIMASSKSELALFTL